MSAIDDLFARLRSQGRKAFMPFVTAGDPDLEFTDAVLRELVRRGSHLCELGIPYSDPIADGPVIQASYTRALARGLKVSRIFDRLGPTIRDLAAPVVTMASFAIVHRLGGAKYVAAAQAAGIAGAIVPDLPVEEAAELSEICKAADFSLIQLATPTTPRERAVRIAESSSGFLYYVSIAGITGERAELPRDLVETVAWLRQRTPLPICIGFGISRPEHVRLLAPVCDGLIVGSAIVRRIAEAANRPREQVLREVGEAVTELMGAMEA